MEGKKKVVEHVKFKEPQKKKVVKHVKSKEPQDSYDEECYEIDAIVFSRTLTFDDADDVVLLADKGPVALRDFPHPRHLCGNYPFHTTSHESYCGKCFCFVCEVAAPCLQWRGIKGHCNISKKA